MKLFMYVTDFIVPLVIFGIVSYGVLMKVNVYDTFIKGAKSGFFTVIKIMPTLIGLMVAVGVHGIHRISRRTGAAYGGKDVLIFGGHGAASGCVQGVWNGLVHRTGGIHQHVLHGDYILHHERLFYDSQSHEDQIYSGGRHACDLCRACGQRGAGWYDGGRVRGFLSFIRESGIKTLLGTLRIIGPDE